MNAVARPKVVVMRRMTGRGLGQTDPALLDPTDLGWTTTNLPAYIGSNTIPTVGSPVGTGPAAGGINWGSFLNNLVNQAGTAYRATVAPMTLLPAGSTYVTSPYGTSVTTGGVPNLNAITSQLGGMLPILLIGGVVLVVIMMAGHK
jgi:hypothetical protein